MTFENITILGGTGFIGSRLAVDLAGQCRKVTVLTRRRQRLKDLRVVSNIDIVEVDVHNPDALSAAVANSDAVINLVGILNQSSDSGPHSFQGAHVDLTQHLMQALLFNNIPRYVHMSSLNAGIEHESASEYLNSKGRAEQIITELAPEHMQVSIMQPSVIFGAGDSFFNRFAGLIQNTPVMPLACPDAKLSPVYVDDVCDAIVTALNSAKAGIQRVPLCGPRDYTLRELVKFTADTLDVNRPIIGLPDWAARLQARIMGVLPGKPFSTDNYLSLQIDSVCDASCIDAGCRQNTSIEAMVPRYFGTSGNRSQQQQYRRLARR